MGELVHLDDLYLDFSEIAAIELMGEEDDHLIVHLRGGATIPISPETKILEKLRDDGLIY